MDSDDLPYKVIVSGIPAISKPKLIKRLQEAFGTKRIQLDYITKSSAKVSFNTEEELNGILASRLDIPFGGSMYNLTVRKCDFHSSSAASSSRDSQRNSTSFVYEPSEKSDGQILKYVSKTQQYKAQLRLFLQQQRLSLKSITDKEIQVEAQGANARPSEKFFNECIEKFLEHFSSWNEELLNCTNEDGTFIIRTLSKYKSKCFGNWYSDTNTILVTGPNNIIQDIKDEILERISRNHPNKSSSPMKQAEEFCFSDVKPGVIRFVAKKRLRELRGHMENLAEVTITTEEKITSVKLTPTPRTRKWLHTQFESTCISRLEEFFSDYCVWKETFDCSLVHSVRPNHPNSFKESSDQDHHIRWFLDTGTVIVSGLASAVKLHRQSIENMLGISPKQNRFNSASAQKISSGLPQLSYDAISPRTPTSRSRHISSSSDETASVRSESTKVPCSTEDIPRAVLLFVLKDLKTKKRFEKCCMPFAKAVIRSEKIDGHEKICLFANLKREDPTTAVQRMAIETIHGFFDQFETQTKKYGKQKLKELADSEKDLFKPVIGEVHILYFEDSGTVKVTGITEKVTEKHEEIARELDVTTYIEKVDAADVFIAQRECNVWTKVEQACKDIGLRVSISSKLPGEIQFRGNRLAIFKARTLLGENSEKLFETQLQGFTDDQICLLRKCEESQKQYLNTRKNLMDAVYDYWKDNSVMGSIIFHDANISLISTDRSQWKKASDLLQQFLFSFFIDVESTASLSLRKVYKAIKAAFKDEAVFVKEMHTEKKLEIHCFANQKDGIKRKVKEIIEETHDSGKIQKFHEMPNEKAKHFLNPHGQCKIYKAEKLESEKRGGKHGLVITCEKEDLDTVEMQLTDLLNEIVCQPFTFPGYFLYEILNNSANLLQIEHDTNCSIFLHRLVKAQSKVKISVQHGNILDVKCDAIVNSTGTGLGFTSSSQVNKALTKKHGASVLKDISKSRQVLMPTQAAIYTSRGKLPWPYVINVSTPNERDKLTEFIQTLLEALNALKLPSLALPTIGTGNMGMDPATVASCMKEAFKNFCSSQSTKHLRDIKVIVYDANLVNIFLDIVPQPGQTSNGIHGSIYANKVDKVQQAWAKLEKLCKESVVKEVICDPMVAEFSSFIKTKAGEICQNHQVYLEWKSNGGQDQCILQGPIEEVRKTKEEIEKLFATGPNWTPMTGRAPFEKVKLAPTSSEYRAVEIKFKQSSPNFQVILKIERIQNPLQYQQYKARKTAKLATLQNVSKQLFHGTTPENVNAICLYGFNRTYAGENGTLYGCGVYFHVNSCYSVSYSGYAHQKCMFLADVITGEYTKGSQELKCAPMNHKTGEAFDSVVDSTHDPKIFVVFPDSSCYPTYLITFA